MNRVLIMGIGNAYRGDDAAGLMVAERLMRMNLEGVAVELHSGEAAALIEAWAGADSVIAVDAMRSGGVPGTVLRLEADRLNALESFVSVSSHGLGLSEAVRLGRVMQCLPSRLVIYGIEARDFEYGGVLSPEVEAAVGEVVERIVQELKCMSLG